MLTRSGGGTTSDTLSLPSQISGMPQGSLRSFLEKMLPVAEYVNSQTGISRRLLLSQYTIESGEGTSEAARIDENFAGIEPWGSYHAGGDPSYVGFASPAAFGRGQAAFYNQNANYKALEAAGRSGASIDQQAVLLGESGYAGGGYREPGGGLGSSLISETLSLFGGQVGTAGTGGAFPSGQKHQQSAPSQPPSIWEVISSADQGIMDQSMFWIAGLFNGTTERTAGSDAMHVGQVLSGWWSVFIQRMLLVAFFGLAALIILWVVLSQAGVAIPIPI